MLEWVQVCLFGITAGLEPAWVKLCRYFMVCKPSLELQRVQARLGMFPLGLVQELDGMYNEVLEDVV